MVVVKLVGGLASQLHKYAVIKSICTHHNQEMKVDLSFFNDRMFNYNNIMEYGLPKLGIEPAIATQEDIAKAKGYNFLGSFISKIFTSSILNRNTNSLFERVLNRLESYSRYRNLISNSYLMLHVTNSIDRSWIETIKKNENSYVFAEFGIGFEYLENVRGDISASILHADISEHANNFKKIILSEEKSVAMHVRRGDYVHNQNVNSFHGVCSIEYYEKSIQLLSQEKGYRFFIFSDDIDWVKENFTRFIPSNTVIISGNRGHEDFLLMSCCKYHIIANSGFSSMASWLSMVPNQHVYSPERWFIDEETNKNQKQLLPSDWNYL